MTRMLNKVSSPRRPVRKGVLAFALACLTLWGSMWLSRQLAPPEIQEQVRDLSGAAWQGIDRVELQDSVDSSKIILNPTQTGRIISSKLANSDLSRLQLRRMFDLFEQKTQLMRLLDGSSRADGVRIYIGGESQVVPFEELSVVSAPYEIHGQVVGTLGVIGPTRMAYDRMIEIVDITSRLVSNALSQK